MFEQIAQIRILLANVNAYLQSIVQENDLLRKEIQKLKEENNKLKEDK